MAEIGSSSDIQNLLEYMDAAETEGFRESLMALLMEHTDLEPETIYELVFNNGRNIIWC